MTEEERAWLLKELKQQERPVYDAEGIRWVTCKYCGQILPGEECLSYGGIGMVNLGECRSCGPRLPEEIYSDINFQKFLREMEGLGRSDFYTPDAAEIDSIEEMFAK